MSELRHRWRVDLNYLVGITAGHWGRLLRQERFAVDPVYWHRAALITLASLGNGAWAQIEGLLWNRRIAQTHPPDPIVIVGHYRQGTTHLHNLLALDPHLGFPTTYAVSNPYTFLTTERIGARLLAPLLPARRPQDGMRLGFDLPQEDEYALALMSLVSPFLGISFPRSRDRYLPHLAPQGADRRRWQAAFRLLLTKLAVRDPRPMVLKSPPHTARVAAIREVCPGAKFLHIRRDPYVVFQSTRHLFATTPWFLYLQRPDLSELDDQVLTWYATMYDAWFAESPDIPPGHVCEIDFEDLEADPVGTLRGVYRALDLGELDVAKVEGYLGGLAHRRNRYAPLSDAERHRVATRWSRAFAAFGYPV